DDVDDLALGSSRLTGQHREIRAPFDSFENRVKGTENLAWSPFERLGERGDWCTGQSEASCRDRHSQNLAPRKSLKVVHVGGLLNRCCPVVPVIWTDARSPPLQHPSPSSPPGRGPGVRGLPSRQNFGQPPLEIERLRRHVVVDPVENLAAHPER